MKELKMQTPVPSTAEPAAETQRRRMPTWAKSKGFFNSQYIGLLAGLVALSVVMTILSPYFLQPRNLINIGGAVSFTGIVAAITTAVLISGGLDLSIAANMALSSCVAALLLKDGAPWFVAVIVALIVGALAGALNGYIINYVGVNAFVVTVASQFLLRGIAYIITAGVVLPVNDSTVVFLGQGRVFGIPIPLLIMALAFLFVGWMLKSTVWGRHWYAIGGTPGGRMAELAGVPVKRRGFQLYVLSGVISAAAGVVVAGYTTVGDPNAVAGTELSILAAVILGGTALSGGRGSIVGTIIGVFLIGVINNGIQLLNFGIAAQYLSLGAVLLGAVVYDQIRTRKETR
jgi:ribose/xylose/arabinose/galactoside ABC-type transport system permease subunit